MSIGSIVSWIVCGLVVGALARMLVPGRQTMSLPMTALLGPCRSDEPDKQ